MASRTLIIGAAGAVGKELSRALKNAGSVIIAADRHEHLPSSIKGVASVLVGGVDVRDERAVSALIREHACPKTTVWNLAAPLSVETGMQEMLRKVFRYMLCVRITVLLPRLEENIWQC